MGMARFRAFALSLGDGLSQRSETSGIWMRHPANEETSLLGARGLAHDAADGSIGFQLGRQPNQGWPADRVSDAIEPRL